MNVPGFPEPSSCNRSGRDEPDLLGSGHVVTSRQAPSQKRHAGVDSPRRRSSAAIRPVFIPRSTRERRGISKLRRPSVVWSCSCSCARSECRRAVSTLGIDRFLTIRTISRSSFETEQPPVDCVVVRQRGSVGIEPPELRLERLSGGKHLPERSFAATDGSEVVASVIEHG
jgi:hypothetical protein